MTFQDVSLQLNKSPHAQHAHGICGKSSDCMGKLDICKRRRAGVSTLSVGGGSVPVSSGRRTVAGRRAVASVGRWLGWRSIWWPVAAGRLPIGGCKQQQY